MWLTPISVTLRTRPCDSSGSPSEKRRTSSAYSCAVTRVGTEDFLRGSGAAWREHLWTEGAARGTRERLGAGR